MWHVVEHPSSYPRIFGLGSLGSPGQDVYKASSAPALNGFRSTPSGPLPAFRLGRNRSQRVQHG